MSTTTTPAIIRGRHLPNLWDIAALIAVVGALIAIANAVQGTFVPIQSVEAGGVTLDPWRLPEYALRTTLRMFAALLASLIFTFTYAPLAAKSRRARLIMIPILDVLQSVPILGFLTFTTAFFMSLFPGRVMGLELASMFAIFTSQAWNMAFSFYQALITVPGELDEAARGFRLTAWQRFWRLEAPFGAPGLVWNTMLSMSGGWFFVVASEAITLGEKSWTLPGIGSYVALALRKSDIGAVFEAIAAMLVVIIAYDQLLFRPLVAWSAKFRFETTAGATANDPWVLALLRRTRVLRAFTSAVGDVLNSIGALRLTLPLRARPIQRGNTIGDAIFFLTVAAVLVWALWKVAQYVSGALTWNDVGEAVLLGLFTLLRVIVLMALAALVWVPVGVWLGLRPAWARRVQPLAQFLAAFPANLLFPPIVLMIVAFHLTPDIWLTPLMVLGTQWYILFNVIAGAAAFPGDLREAADNFRVAGFMWWRRVMLPGILPYFVTGAVTASGGSWNASIVAEVASWGDTKLAAHGLGAYIARATDAGNFERVVLGVVVMSLYVLATNRLLWRPLYAYASRRTTLG
jgi:NitT/TauT family transport system permease protein